MAKNLNSLGFTVLLLVLLIASTEILRTEAQCGTFVGECGDEPFTGTDVDCTACCVAKFGAMVPPVAVCAGHVETEGTEKHCHCYGP